MKYQKTITAFCVSLLVSSCISFAQSKKPVWADNNLGKKACGTDYIDPDFSPIKVSGNTVMSGFKKMSLNSFGLPQSSLWRDSKILKNPVRIIFENANGAVKLKEGKFTLEKAGKNAARGRAIFETDGVNFEITSKFDFDFTITYDIKLSPIKGKKADIKKLSLIFPMNVTANDEKLVMYYAEGPNRAESGLEAQKRRVHLSIKGGDYREIDPGFCSLFWVGTTNYGLSWNFESAKDWNSDNELIFDPRSGEFAMNIIQKPTVLKKTVNYKFFLTPTPIKKMPKNWRSWNYGWRGSTQQVINRKLFNQLIYWSSTWRATNAETFNSHWVRSQKDLKKAAIADKGMHKANYYIPQLVTSALSIEDEDGDVHVIKDQYLQELSEKYHRKPGRAGKKLDIPEDAIFYDSIEKINAKNGKDFLKDKKNIQKACTSDVVFVPPLADHMVYGLNKFINDYGVGGIYYDGINPQQNYSEWAAWTDQNGKLRPFFHFSDQRALLKRMRYLVKDADPNEVIVAHQSGVRPASTLSLCDAIIPGETFFYWYHEPDVRDASPSGDFYYANIVGDIDNLKGEFFYRQWGVPHILLPEIRGRNGRVFPKAARGTRTMLAHTIHFDMLYFPTMCDVNEIYKWYKIRNEYGMSDTNMELIEFVPYWENKIFKSDNKNVKISYYNKVKQQELYTSYDIRKKYMVIVSNLQFSDHKFQITLPEGLKKAKVREMQTSKIIPVNNGKFDYSLLAYDFAVFEITGELDDKRGSW